MVSIRSTIGWTQFYYSVHRLLLEAFSEKGTEPERVAEYLLSKLPLRPTYKRERPALEEFVDRRQITQLVHFTRIENVPSICKYGLIPRAHLNEAAIRVFLNPLVTDKKRIDNSPQANCLSFSFPNYRMFYNKRQNSRGDWAVLSIDPKVIVELYCDFYSTNAASSGINPSQSVEGAQRLFSSLDLRKQLDLRTYETTDPQAEILEDTVITVDNIKNIFVEYESAQRRLESRGINALVKPDYFAPRRDYRFWSNHPVFEGWDDYAEVLAYDNANNRGSEIEKRVQ